MPWRAGHFVSLRDYGAGFRFVAPARRVLVRLVRFRICSAWVCHVHINAEAHRIRSRTELLRWLSTSRIGRCQGALEFGHCIRQPLGFRRASLQHVENLWTLKTDALRNDKAMTTATT